METLGDKYTSEEELRLIGIGGAKNEKKSLGTDDIDNLNLIINGKANYKEFLNSPPNYDKDYSLIYIVKF
ncbi:MAG: hypothetical protein ACYT04_20625 [Nostoc sp.]